MSKTYQKIMADKQRSHVLLVFIKVIENYGESLPDWLISSKEVISNNSQVENIRVFSKESTRLCECSDLGFEFLMIIDLGFDGAEESVDFIQKLHFHFKKIKSISTVSTWLYYPVSELVGDVSIENVPFITIAFANPLLGHEREFAEWYSTQHIRHALYVPELVNSQRFELSSFQVCGGSPSPYRSIAIYGQNANPEQMLASLSKMDLSKLAFSDSMDKGNFTEWSYRLLLEFNS